MLVDSTARLALDKNQETRVKTPVSLTIPNQRQAAGETSSPDSLNMLKQPVEETGVPPTSTSGNTLSMNVNFESVGEEALGAMAAAPGGKEGTYLQVYDTNVNDKL